MAARTIVIAVRLGLDDEVLIDHFQRLPQRRKVRSREAKRLWMKGLDAEMTEMGLRRRIAELEKIVARLEQERRQPQAPMPPIQAYPPAYPQPSLELEDLKTEAHEGENPEKNLDSLLGAFLGPQASDDPD